MDWKAAGAALAAVLFPNRCIFCGALIAEKAFCCAECAEKLVPAQERISLFPDGKMPHCDAILSVYRYDNLSRRAIFRLKFYGDFSVVEPIAGLMTKRVADAAALRGETPRGMLNCVMPVPMHRLAERKRGFNQSILLAKRIAGRLGLPYDGRTLRKVTRTRKQHDLTYLQRRQNLRHSFGVTSGAALGGSRILLIDDVCTTGNTLEHCAAVLKRAGAETVICLTFLQHASQFCKARYPADWEDGKVFLAQKAPADPVSASSERQKRSSGDFFADTREGEKV